MGRGFVEIETEFSHITGTGPRYKVFQGGELLLESSRDPIHEAARALLAAGGFDPDDTIIQRKRGAPHASLSARIGWAAAHTTTEGQTSGPRTVPWVPYTGPGVNEDE